MITSTLAVILVFGGLILFHELGHFSVARMLGIGVPAFSLGFGPVIARYTRGKTEYRLSIIPFGGYVRLAGDTPDNELPEGFTEAESFNLRPAWHRMLVVLAGPLANILLAWLILTALFLAHGRTEVPPVVGELMPDSAALEAGMQPGDRIVSINGHDINYWRELKETVTNGGDAPMDMVVDRGNTRLNLSVTPRIQVRKNLFGEEVRVPLIGITSTQETITIPLGGAGAAVAAAERTWEYGTIIMQALVKMIERVIPAENIGGPIMIVQMISQQAEYGLASVLAIAAMLSVNLGLINLLPIPVLDGGHVLFLAIEMITRRKLNERAQNMALRIGVLVLFSIMGLAIFNDLHRIFS